MISVRRAQDRGVAKRGWLDSRHTFSFGGYQDPDHMGFATPRSSARRTEIIDQAHDFPEQFPRHGNLGQLERDVPTMAHDLGANLDQLLP